MFEFNIKHTCVQHRLRVVPLFETVKDLRGAGSVIRKLLSIDWYRQHIIKNHNGQQEVIYNNGSFIYVMVLPRMRVLMLYMPICR